MMKLNLLSKSIMLSLFAVLFAFGTGIISAQSQTTGALTVNGTFTVPCGVTSVKIKAIGGGGAGGYFSNGSTGSGGGGGGAYSEITLSNLDANQQFTYTVGAGGIATTGIANGLSSKVMSKGVLVLEANGGAGGSGQTGGSGGSVISGALYKMNKGGNGAAGTRANQNKIAGGGGAAGNSLGNGGDANESTGGKTATIPNPPTTYGGNGGTGGTVGTVGFDYGGGGAGSTGNTIGANGAGGVVVFEYTTPPAISSGGQPTSVAYCAGTTRPTLQVSATGTNLSYQWYKATSATSTVGSQPVTDPGATTASFPVPSSTETLRYFYVVIKGDNVCGGGVVSNIVTVTRNTVPTITTQPTPTSAYCIGAPASLNVSASGTGTLSYQWFKNSTPSTSGALAVGTGASYTPSTATVGTDYYYVVVTGGGSCGTVTSEFAQVIVNPNVTAGTISPANSSICAGATRTLSSNGTSGGTWSSDTTAVATVNPTTGVVTGVSAGTATIRYSVTGCGGTKNVTTQVTVTPATAITVQPAATANYCANSTAAALKVTATGTGTLTYQWFGNGSEIPGATSFSFIPPTTAEGTINYYVTVTGPCGQVTSDTAAVIVGAKNTYSSSGWSAGSANSPNYDAVIAADYSTANGDIVACSCTVNNGATLTIAANRSATIRNSIVNNGNFVVESDGNLIQLNESAVNVGNITVYRDSPMRKNNYTYWGSPVTGQQLGAFSPGTSSSRFYQYLQATNQFSTVTPLTSTFVPGKGYAIMAPSTYSLTSTTTFKGAFVGVPNNGDQIKFTLEKGAALPSKGFNMIGNPYPSNIDFDKLHAKNQDAIHLTAYFWTNVDPNRPGSVGGNVNYSGNGYAIYNGTGSLASVQPAGSTEVGAVPTNIIKVGQGFIIKAKDDANGKTLTFDNTIRDTSGNSHFFSKQVSTVKDRFWLKLTTPARNVNTILIGYIENATNGFEYDYDSPLMVVGSDSFYSVLDDKKLGIQGRSYPLEKSDVVQLGTKHFENGDYIISLGNHEGIFSKQQAIYLMDLQKNITTNLSEGDYTFTSDAGEFSKRFQIVFEPRAALGVDVNVTTGIDVYSDAQDFVVRAASKKIESCEVVDMLGRMIFASSSKGNELRIDAANWASGIYIIKATLDNGSTYTTKVRR